MLDFNVFDNFLMLDEQLSLLNLFPDSFASLSIDEKEINLNKLIELLNDFDNYDAKLASTLVFVFQKLQNSNLLSQQQQIIVFNKLISLCTTNIFSKRYAVSNAVSLTLRPFFSNANFPKDVIQSGFDFLINKMPPISRGFGSNRSQLCWNKTFKDFLNILNIPKNDDLDLQIFNITRLNMFQHQLADSYNVEMNSLLNSFYKRFFYNVSDIIIHDIKKSNKNTNSVDKAMQRQGIDKTIILEDSKEIFIEEKFRTNRFWDNRNTDILLEYVSIDNKNIPGWVYTSKSDYLVIVFQSIKFKDSELYIFPFEPIRSWVRNNDSTFMKFKDVSAHNVSWNTLSKIVPLDIIFNILKDYDNKFSKIHKLT